MDSGIGVSFLTSKVARDVEQMAKIYGVPPTCSGEVPQRWPGWTRFEKASGYKDDEICYVGDEMIDLGIMKRVFFSVAPSDGSPEARAIADLVTQRAAAKA
jgi:3-deoxy-D-manno-octulosonate 8-phosphate phosphatase (KDO 8-P phosphatase)